MIIDFISLILLVMAIFKGYSKGLVVAVFSMLAFFVGLIAAVKLSASVADWMNEKAGSESSWMPFIAFAAVMLAVLILVRLLAKVVERTLSLAFLGSANKLGGILFYLLIYLMFYSIVLFYASNMGILGEETIQSSKTYGIVAPLGPGAVEAIGAAIPVFKGLFRELEDFFDATNRRIS